MTEAYRRVRKLSPAERWFHDGLLVCQVPAMQASLEVDMSSSADIIQRARSAGIRLTYAHLFVRAAALVLHRNPRLHTMLCGSRLHTHETVDIALSVSSDDAVTPVVIIKAAEHKPLSVLAEEIIRKTPEAQREQAALLAMLNRWGWVVPFGFLRRALLRMSGRSVKFRRAGSGTFQVSVLRGVDRAETAVFNTTAMLTAGEVRDRIVAHDGKPVVRPMVTFTCSADHRVWNGGDCRTFLHGLAQVLNSRELAEECGQASSLVS